VFPIETADVRVARTRRFGNLRYGVFICGLFAFIKHKSSIIDVLPWMFSPILSLVKKKA
jgi:hypothetical protein